MTNHANPYAAPQFPEGPAAAQPASQPKKRSTGASHGAPAQSRFCSSAALR